MTTPTIYYSESYDISMLGMEKLHPFDSRKSSRSLAKIRSALGKQAETLLRTPQTSSTRDVLELVHSRGYLENLRRSRVIAKALELWCLSFVPATALDRGILLPMRWVVQGTIEAAKSAMLHGAAINLGGGYHHAHRDRGEGFCIYADVPVAIEALRRDGVLSSAAHIAIIDLDAHRGNGFESIYDSDPNIHFFDMYNFQVYPGRLKDRSERHEDIRSLRAYMDDTGYFNVLKGHLPNFLRKHSYSIVFYNAGTDVLSGDPVGRFGLSRQAVLDRDRFVVEAIEQIGVPWVMVPSGGYTVESHELLADTVSWVCGRHGRE